MVYACTVHVVCFVLLVWFGEPPLWPQGTPYIVCAGLEVHPKNGLNRGKFSLDNNLHL